MIDLSFPIPDLTTALENLVREIPSGSVTTFGLLARALGDVTAARWIAVWAKSAAEENQLPWHRILRATGELWSDNLGQLQSTLLAREKIPVENLHVDLSNIPLYTPPSTELLAPLLQLQHDCAAQRQIIPLTKTPTLVGGVDISYRNQTAVAAYTLVDLNTSELLWHVIRETPITFPYITGYLAFREIPALLPVLQAAKAEKKLAPVILVDGNGQLHPRRAGIATLLGVLINHPTIGVGKSLICGKLQDSKNVTTRTGKPLTQSNIIDRDEPLGVALASPTRHKPLYISPGHLTDIKSGTDIVLQLLTTHRLPEPLHQADHLSRQATKK